uniref:Conserved secreted protein n=1 Tax=Caenorhabditis tropicalis TaxID=1561998 RepID=A0A1I7U438_9PELO
MQSFIVAALLVVCVSAQYYQQQQQPNNQQYLNNQYQTTTRGYNQYGQQNQFGQTQFGQTTTPRYTSQAMYGTTQSGRQFDQAGNQVFFNSVGTSSAALSLVGAALYAIL